MKRSVKGWEKVLMMISAWILLGTACSDDETQEETTEVPVTTVRLCIVMPRPEVSVWQRDVDWALQNFQEAQQGLPSRIDFDVEWVDEEADDIDAQLKRVAADTSLVAIVGPYTSGVAYKAATACSRSQKPLILPTASSVELQRMFAGKDYVWNLTQSDITQCEILLTQASLSECTRVSLLTSDDRYGQSFSDWFAYQAQELGLAVEQVDIYRSDADIEAAVARHAGHSSAEEMLLFAPSSHESAVAFDAAFGRLKAQYADGDFPKVLCSDLVNAYELTTQLTHAIYEGISPCSSPMSGFDSAFRVRFGEEPTTGEAHLYDAVSLVAYAATARVGDEDMNDVIRRIVDGRETWSVGWLPADMRRSLIALRAGDQPDLSGVSGDWTFDARTHASVLNTTYAHWVLRDGAYTTLEYLSSDGSGRTTSTLQAWETQATSYQTFSESQADVTYGPLADRYAVIIGTSDTWENYRHQADALAMYQVLKRHGYDDDHILLIIADNLAYDANNLYPGIVRVRPNGENVYNQVQVDYRLSDVSFADLDSILLGHACERLPKVLPTDESDNILVYWCGHGNYGHLAWGSEGVVTGEEVADVFRRMKEQGRFRKLLMAVDACYSGSIGEACEGIPGMLAVTAATPYEPSKADVMDDAMGIWLSNAFTRVFQETIDEDPTISIRNLYYDLSRATLWSHVTVYNEALYGNLFHSTMNEFLGE
jgi:ABC-type branched-subunit amino acid transport system substrate-binding protein